MHKENTLNLIQSIRLANHLAVELKSARENVMKNVRVYLLFKDAECMRTMAYLTDAADI